jgi:hypothetical protein
MKEQTQTITENTDAIVATISAHQQVGQDLKNAVLIVSIVANLFILTTWIALQLTTVYDAELAGVLLGR